MRSNDATAVGQSWPLDVSVPAMPNPAAPGPATPFLPCLTEPSRDLPRLTCRAGPRLAWPGLAQPSLPSLAWPNPGALRLSWPCQSCRANPAVPCTALPSLATPCPALPSQSCRAVACRDQPSHLLLCSIDLFNRVKNRLEFFEFLIPLFHTLELANRLAKQLVPQLLIRHHIHKRTITTARLLSV